MFGHVRFSLAFILLLWSSLVCSNTRMYECTVRWQPTLDELDFRGAAEDSVVLGTAPDGEPAIQRNVVKGPNDIAQIKLNLFSHRVEAARIVFEVYLPEDFAFSVAGHKLPLGLWGGTADSRCMAGGCPAEQQDGFSLRLTNSSGILNLYSYHLNRDTQVEPSGQQYGKVFVSDVEMEKGRWLAIEIDLKLNTPDKDNGEVWLRLDGQEIFYSAGLHFRNSYDWWIKGPLLTDLWGGNIYLWGSQSPKEQKIWYRNYRITSLSSKPSCD